MENIIYGKNTAIEFLKTKPELIEKVYIYNNMENNKATREIFNLLKKNKTFFVKSDKNKLNSICEGANHQGIVLKILSRPYVEIEDILKKAREKNELPFILALDSINDPHNFGSIIRTAEFAGVHGIITSKRNSAGLTGVAVKVSSGAAAYLPIARVANLNYAIEKLKKENLWIIGADSNADKLYNNADYKMPVCLVLGSEAEGISALLKKSCDFLVKIPQYGGVSSLNVGVSAGILIYEIINQRKR